MLEHGNGCRPSNTRTVRTYTVETYSTHLSGVSPLQRQMRGMECVLPSRGCHSPLLSSAIRSQSRVTVGPPVETDPARAIDRDAELRTSRGGQRVDTPPLRRLLHPSPSILPGIMAVGHASCYKTGLRSEPTLYTRHVPGRAIREAARGRSYQRGRLVGPDLGREYNHNHNMVGTGLTTYG